MPTLDFHVLSLSFQVSFLEVSHCTSLRFTERFRSKVIFLTLTAFKAALGLCQRFRVINRFARVSGLWSPNPDVGIAIEAQFQSLYSKLIDTLLICQDLFVKTLEKGSSKRPLKG
jgi:hypothetical protein